MSVILCFCHTQPQRKNMKMVINMKGERHGAKFICAIHERCCGNEVEVKRK